MQDPPRSNGDRLRLGWVLFACPHRAIPELLDLEPDRARAVYRRATGWACRAAAWPWIALGQPAAVLAVMWGAHQGIANRRWLAFWICAALALSAWIFLTIKEAQLLRRGVRAELGTHCPACDYDIRHSRQRCPECGRLVSRPERRLRGSRRPGAENDH